MQEKEVIPQDQEIRLQANRALQFLNDHPGIGYNETFMMDGNFFMSEKCEHGQNDHMVKINYNKANYNKYKKEFDKEFKEMEDDKFFSKKNSHIYLPYNKLYGKKWKFDHIEYYFECSFFVYDGPVENHKIAQYEHKNWLRYQGEMVKGYTYERALIKMADRVKEVFGDYSSESFHSKKESENHSKENSFKFKKTKDGMSELLDNPKYIDVTKAMINIRWFNWFMTTDYCKKNWKAGMKQFRKHIEKYSEFIV